MQGFAFKAKHINGIPWHYTLDEIRVFSTRPRRRDIDAVRVLEYCVYPLSHGDPMVFNSWCVEDYD
jgi:hypothetical protein